MDNKIFSKFNLYDQFAYLLVGSVGLGYIAVFVGLADYSFKIPALEISNSILWLISAYYYGHIIQAIANIIIREDKSNFSDSEKEVLDDAKVFFESKNTDYNFLFQLCYQKVLKGDNSLSILTFVANYGLYRGWFVVNILQTLLFLFLLVSSWFSFKILIVLLLFSLLSFLFYKRKNRFFTYLRTKVIQNTQIIISEND